MRSRLRAPAIMCVCLGLAVTAGLIPAQQPFAQPPAAQPPQPAAAAGDGVDVLARGPVHEAYADSAAAPDATPLVTKAPPDAVDELPPDQKPSGESVQWIPGYWHFDEDRGDFIWISGFWRDPPPGRVWVAGSWRTVQGGWQWVPGFWQTTAPVQAQQPQQPGQFQPQPAAQVQSDVQYLATPPATIEVGPTTPAPSVSSFYIPGTWVWRGRYVWRPGVWVELRPGWVWVPAHFRWTPIGYIYVEGYWDYPLSRRGVLYAPVAFSPTVIVQPGYVYAPTYVVSDQCMMGAMFVRRGWGCYYFGDYYAPQYATVGYTAWCGTVGVGGGFAIGFGVGRAWGYDPLWSYYSVAYRDSPAWRSGMGELYVGRYRGTIAPPPVSLTQQNIVINRVTNVNVTNVTNNFTVVNRSITVNNVNVSGLAMVAPHKIVADMHPEVRFQPVPMQARREEAHAARQLREAGVQRARVEHAVMARGGGIPKTTDTPHSVKLEVPKTAMARAQVLEEKHAPPVNPHHPAATTPGVAPKVDHPMIDPKRPVPKMDPHFPVVPKHTPLHVPAHGPAHEPKRDPKQ
jgi:hypothetical protein